MRWKEKARPKRGDYRTVEVFLLFPKKITGEWRWLEKANIRQTYKYGVDGYGTYSCWIDMYWAN